MPQEPTRDELFKLYQVAIDEYRFEVKLNSDRSIHYVVFNSAVLTAATGLLKIGASPHLNFFVTLVFGIGACTAWLGVRSIRKGHEYYHRAILKKTLLEELLGLTAIVKDYPTATLAIGTTAGQADIDTILRDPRAWLAAETPKRGSITHAGILVLRLLLAANIAGMLAAIYLMTSAAPYILWP
ncbi:MAG TPA: hypothetical protein VNY05_41550 [Candidatus Acidoferrales bacterium]|nr:hypothetical protein [Candidatus Acidoferrales bacterium]